MSRMTIGEGRMDAWLPCDYLIGQGFTDGAGQGTSGSISDRV